MKLITVFLLLIFVFLIVGCVEEVEQEEITVDDIQVIVVEQNHEIVDESYDEDYYEEYFYEKKANEELEEEKESSEVDYEEEEVDEPVTEEEEPVEEEAEDEVPAEDCTSGWYITGYYTPHEEDFSGEMIEVDTDVGSRFFKEDFLDVVKTEGWGKTLQNDYLGYYWDSWHINDKDLDAQGNELIKGTVAVDPAILTPGTQITIPTLPSPYNQQIYSVTDTGVTGQHIDIFTGEGKEAELETYKITGEDNTICVLE